MGIIRCAAGIYRYLHQPPTRGHATSSLPLGDKPRVALSTVLNILNVLNFPLACFACYGACRLPL